MDKREREFRCERCNDVIEEDIPSCEIELGIYVCECCVEGSSEWLQKQEWYTGGEEDDG